MSYHDQSLQHVHQSQQQVEHKKQKVPPVLKAQAIIDPRTMVVHYKGAPIADWTVVHAGWLYVFTLFALFLHKSTGVVCRLVSIAQECFNLLWDPFKSVVVQVVLNWFTIGSFLYLISHGLNLAQIMRTSRLYNHGESVIENYVEKQSQPDSLPSEGWNRSESFLERCHDEAEESINMN